MRYENLQTPNGSSPFLKTFLKTDRVWDDAAQTEWADDVERRLRAVTAQIVPRPILRGYSITACFMPSNAAFAAASATAQYSMTLGEPVDQL